MMDTGMFEPTIETASMTDIQGLVSFLAGNTPHVAASTIWQVPWTWQFYRVIRDECGEIIAAASLQPVERGRAEVRGLAVHRQWRQLGLATLLVEDLLGRANESALEAVCVTRKPEFFRQFGFEDTAPFWLDLCRRQQESSRKPSDRGSSSCHPRVAMALMQGAIAC